MNILQAIILSIIEGVTEFLPVSSTGHLILASNLMGIADSEFTKSFEIIIQLGAILAVLVLYWKRIFSRRYIWLPVLVAFLPSAVIGVTLYKLIKAYLLGNALVVVIALFIGGLLLILIDKFFVHKPVTNTHSPFTIRQAFIIGIFQCFSMVPGVSRAAATIIGGMFSGLSRADAVEFSFLLAIPTMAAATGLDLLKSSMHFSGNETTLLAVGFVGAFVTALAAIKSFVKYVQNHGFMSFGIYRIVLATVYYLLILR